MALYLLHYLSRMFRKAKCYETVQCILHWRLYLVVYCFSFNFFCFNTSLFLTISATSPFPDKMVLFRATTAQVICDHHDVAEVAVVGVKDELKGQVPLGLIVLNSHCTRDPQ